jgi:hypothetical protein
MANNQTPVRRRALSTGFWLILIFVLIVIGLFLFINNRAKSPVTSSLSSFPLPIDPQKVQDQDQMTWADYRPIPGQDWADPSLKPERGFKLAVVAIDFPDQPFVMTRPKGSDPFGNPQIDPIARESVASVFC